MKHTLASALIEKLRAWLRGGGAPPPEPPLELPPDEPEPVEDTDPSDLVETQVTLPPTVAVGREATEQVVQSLSYASHPLGF